MGQTEMGTRKNRGILAGLKRLYARHEAFWDEYYERVHPALHVVVIALCIVSVAVLGNTLLIAFGHAPYRATPGAAVYGTLGAIVVSLFTDYATGRWP